MGKLLPLLGLCLLGGLAFFFLQDDGRRVGPQPNRDHAARSPVGGAMVEDAPASAALTKPGTLPPAPVVRTEFSETGSGSARAASARSRVRTLKGMLVANGQPQRGGQLLLYAGSQVVGHAESNRKGEFALEFEVPAEDLVLRVTTRGFALLERPIGNQHIPGQQLLGNLFLQKGTPLTGYVINQAGAPIPGAEITLSQVVGRSANKKLGERTRSDKQGRFVFSSAPNMRLNLTVVAEGYGLQTLNHFHTPGKEPTIKLSPGTSLRVTLKEPSGKPILGARLSLRSNHARVAPRQSTSNAEGIALFDNLIESDWSLHSIAAGYRPQTKAGIPRGTTEISMTLLAWPRARGKLRAPKGQPLPTGSEVLAILFSQRGDFTPYLPKGTPVEADGSYTLSDLRPGRYRVRAIAPGFAPTFSQPFSVADGADATVPEFELQRGGELTLKVTSQGNPLAGVSAEVLRQFPRPTRIWVEPVIPNQGLAQSDARGLLSIDGQAPGELWLILRKDGLVPLQVGPLTIRNNENNEGSPAAKMQLAGSISGRLTLLDGSGLGLARIQMKGGSLRMPTANTGPAGHFKFTNVPPGNYSLIPSGSLGGRMVDGISKSVQVSAGKPTTVELVLRGD